MKRLFISMAVIAASVSGFYSCTSDDVETGGNNSHTAELRVETEISAIENGLRSTRVGSLSSFPDGSELSLFVTDGAWGSEYPLGPYKNVQAKYNSGKWDLTPVVKLGDVPATIFAFYPYSSTLVSLGGAVNINVNHTSQVDYMYGTHAQGQGTINWNNPNVRLQMKHALSLLQFKIRKVNYAGQSKLTSIEVANQEGKKDMPSSASLDISTGKLTYSSVFHFAAGIDDPEGLCTLSDKEPADQKDILEVMVLPVEKVSADGNIRIHFKIDGNVFTYRVPATTRWQQGTKYLYEVLFNGTELVIEDITITDWVEGPKGDIHLY